MAEENNKPDEELDDETEEELDDETEEGSEEETEEESNSNALAGLAGAAGALAAKSGKKSGKPTAKPKKGAKPVVKPKSISKDGSVDLNAKVDEIQKLTDKNTVWTIAGYSFTPAKLMILGTILSGALGGLYGSFEVYKDYMDMKKKIAMYVAPDLSDLYKKMELAQQNAEKSVQYTQDIKNDLKQDIRRVESVAEGVERSSKQSARESELAVRDVQQELRRNSKETDQSIKQIQREVDVKIQKALDNPLAR